MSMLKINTNVYILTYMFLQLVSMGIYMTAIKTDILGLILIVYSLFIFACILISVIQTQQIFFRMKSITISYILVFISQSILMIESYIYTDNPIYLIIYATFIFSSQTQLAHIRYQYRCLMMIFISIYQISRLYMKQFLVMNLIISNLLLTILMLHQIKLEQKKEEEFDKILVNLLQKCQQSKIKCLIKNQKDAMFQDQNKDFSINKLEINDLEKKQQSQNIDLNNYSVKNSNRNLNVKQLIEQQNILFNQSDEPRDKNQYTFQYKNNHYLCIYESWNQIQTISPSRNQGILIPSLLLQVSIIKKNIQNQIYKVSHDMRTPLNAIINMLKCLQDLLDPILDERYLRPSLSSCELLMNLLRDILDQAQLENQQIRIVNRHFKIQNFLKKVIEIFRIQAEKKNITIEMSIDKKVPKRIKSDKFRLKQILINLISNSLKYTNSQGKITIEIQKENEILYRIQIIDNGIGIKQEDMDRLFQDFYKVSDQENIEKNPQGVGLGLQISQELAILLGPKGNKGIQVESEYGKGTTFILHIQNQIEDELENVISEQSIEYLNQKQPYYQTQFIKTIHDIEKNKVLLPQISINMEKNGFDQKNNYTSSLNPKRLFNQLSSISQQSQEFSQISKNKRQSSCDLQLQIFNTIWIEAFNNLTPILIVDDNEFNIIALQFQLEKFALGSDSAISGMEAIKKVKERNTNLKSQFKIVFMDIEMPGMNGEETAKQLLKLNSQLNIVPCSGYEQEELIQKWLSIGMKPAINKPIERPKLKECLLKYLIIQ